MPSGGFLALLDDVAGIMDDVAVMSKIAARKTAGVAGDDLAVGAHQVSGIDPARELPIIWAVAKGSFLNKCVMVPVVLAMSALMASAIMPLMMLGGAYLCYEGVEKILHGVDRARGTRPSGEVEPVADGPVDPAALERSKVAEAIKTDAVLSAEIVVIALSAVADQPLPVRALVLSVIAVVMTVGIYGLIALIVKLDDIGLHLSVLPGGRAAARARRLLGRVLLRGMPFFMKALSAVGTAAMLMVGGGILLHGVPSAHEAADSLLWTTLAGLAAGLVIAALAGAARRLRLAVRPAGRAR